MGCPRSSVDLIETDQIRQAIRRARDTTTIVSIVIWGNASAANGNPSVHPPIDDFARMFMDFLERCQALFVLIERNKARPTPSHRYMPATPIGISLALV
jgi:hypothetical protein